jgi:hypothetical protein
MATTDPGSCTHQAQPPYKSTKKQSLFQKYIYIGDRKDDNLREQFAVIVDDNGKTFPTALVNRIFSNPRYVTQTPPQLLFFMVDPSGNGKSEMGMSVVFFNEQRQMVILFMDSLKMNLSQIRPEKDVVIEVLDKILSHPTYRHCRVVFGVENAPLRSPLEIATALVDIPRFRHNVLNLKEWKQDLEVQYGVPKTAHITFRQVVMFQDLLARDAVVISQDFMTLKNKEESIIKRFHELLDIHQWEQKNEKSGHFHAKINGEDDLLVAVLMCPFWSSSFMLNQHNLSYVRFRERSLNPPDQQFLQENPKFDFYRRPGQKYHIVPSNVFPR